VELCPNYWELNSVDDADELARRIQRLDELTAKVRQLDLASVTRTKEQVMADWVEAIRKATCDDVPPLSEAHGFSEKVLDPF
jgi:hypothetical protein